jgi:hypothetical protein
MAQIVVNSAAPPVTSQFGNQQMLGGAQTEGCVAELHAKYYTQAYRGQSFLGSTAAAGVVVPIYSSTGQVFGIWNVAGNKFNAALQTLDTGLVTLGTPVISSLCLAYVPNAGSGIGTPISAATIVAPLSNIIGTIGGNTVRFIPGTATVASSTALFLMTLGYAYFTTTTTTMLVATGLHYDFDEGVIVPPNMALFLGGNVATGSTMDATLRWSEPPV